MNLAHHLLIAMPSLDDDRFSQSVIYVCEHNNEGAMGIVLNKPSQYALGTLFTHLNLQTHDCALKSKTMLSGGPVNIERCFVLHRDNTSWNSSLSVNHDVTLTSSIDIMQAIAAGKGPEDFMISLGYANWEADQLEQEISDNIWLTTPADTDTVFGADKTKLWQMAALPLGIENINNLYFRAGTA